MKRRSFIAGLFAAPLVPVAVKAAEETFETFIPTESRMVTLPIGMLTFPDWTPSQVDDAFREMMALIAAKED